MSGRSLTQGYEVYPDDFISEVLLYKMECVFFLLYFIIFDEVNNCFFFGTRLIYFTVTLGLIDMEYSTVLESHLALGNLLP